ncbi:MAG: hypothetical protein KDI48_07775 [Xanthomonadales bacterium]|nr:hypothetical protein [Xanthomonadales bacterium]
MSAVPAVGLMGLCPSLAASAPRLPGALQLHALRADGGAIQRVEFMAACTGGHPDLLQRWALHLGSPDEEGRQLWSLDRRGLGYCSRPLQQTLGKPTAGLKLTLVEQSSGDSILRRQLDLPGTGLYLLSSRSLDQLPLAWRAASPDLLPNLIHATPGGAFDALLLSLC